MRDPDNCHGQSYGRGRDRRRRRHDDGHRRFEFGGHVNVAFGIAVLFMFSNDGAALPQQGNAAINTNPSSSQSLSENGIKMDVVPSTVARAGSATTTQRKRRILSYYNRPDGGDGNDNSNNESSSSNNNNNNADDDNDNMEIDCDRFSDLQDEMMHCHDDGYFDHIFDNEQHPDGGDGRPFPNGPPNEVPIQFDMDIFVPQSTLPSVMNNLPDDNNQEEGDGKDYDHPFGLPPRLHKLARLAVATVVTRLLDDQTKYQVILRGDQSWKAGPPPSSPGSSSSSSSAAAREGDGDRRLEYNDRVESHTPTVDKVVNNLNRLLSYTKSKNYDDEDGVDDDYDDRRSWKTKVSMKHKWTWLHLNDRNDEDSINSESESSKIPINEEDTSYSYHSTVPETSANVGDGEILSFRATILYRARWKDSREPVVLPAFANTLREDCITTVKSALGNGIILRAVNRAFDHIKNFLFDSDGVIIERYEYDENDDDTTEDDQDKIVFLRVSTLDGTVSSIYDPLAASSASESEDEDYSSPAESFNMGDEEGYYDGGTFDTPLDLEWGTREWVGVALAAFSLAIATVLSSISSFLHRRQKIQSRWGSIFTEDGVREVLHVGWRYHENGRMVSEPQSTTSAPRPPTSTPHVFMQVYDRRRSSFYNDENSMLKGGAEQEFFVQTTTPNAIGEAAGEVAAALAVSSTHPNSTSTTTPTNPQSTND